MQLEQADRREARQEKARWHAAHRSTPRKPEAPVQAQPKQVGKEREWLWIGDSIPSKKLWTDTIYTTGVIRVAGFKLPCIGS